MVQYLSVVQVVLGVEEEAWLNHLLRADLYLQLLVVLPAVRVLSKPEIEHKCTADSVLMLKL